MITRHTTPSTTAEDMRKSRKWAENFFSGPAGLPISFVLDGSAIGGIPGHWQPVSHRRRIDANISETVFEGNDPGSGLNVRVECLQFKECTLSWDIGGSARFDPQVDSYSFHCGMAPMLGLTLDM